MMSRILIATGAGLVGYGFASFIGWRIAVNLIRRANHILRSHGLASGPHLECAVCESDTFGLLDLPEDKQDA